MPCCCGRSPDNDEGEPQLEEKYTVQEGVLGVGSKGGVRPGICARSGRKVAIKTYVKSELSRQDMQNMRVELRLHQGLQHPVIVEVFDVIESARRVHIIMEVLEGGELFEKVKDGGPLGEKEAALITIRVLRALAYLHARRIVHRDIKMENLIFAKAGGSIKLIDLGLAGVMGAKSKLTQPCGTLGYAAPEVLRKEVYNESVDLWSLGAVCYGMLTGHGLFDGDDEEMFNANISNSIIWSKRFLELPQDTQTFLRTLLSTAPEARPSALQATRHPWLQRVAPEEAAQANSEAMQTATDAQEEAARRAAEGSSSSGGGGWLGGLFGGRRSRRQGASDAGGMSSASSGQSSTERRGPSASE